MALDVQGGYRAVCGRSKTMDSNFDYVQYLTPESMARMAEAHKGSMERVLFTNGGAGIKGSAEVKWKNGIKGS